MWSRNKINRVLATIYFISAPDVCRNKINGPKMFWHISAQCAQSKNEAKLLQPVTQHFISQSNI